VNIQVEVSHNIGIPPQHFEVSQPGRPELKTYIIFLTVFC